MATIALTGGVMAAAVVVGAPAASAIPPGHGFVSPVFGMGCVASADANDNGFLTCSGHGGFWDTLVYCTGNPFPYVGTLADNLHSGTSTSTANSNCFFGVSDIQIREYR